MSAYRANLCRKGAQYAQGGLAVEATAVAATTSAIAATVAAATKATAVAAAEAATAIAAWALDHQVHASAHGVRDGRARAASRLRCTAHLGA